MNPRSSVSLPRERASVGEFKQIIVKVRRRECRARSAISELVRSQREERRAGIKEALRCAPRHSSTFQTSHLEDGFLSRLVNLALNSAGLPIIIVAGASVEQRSGKVTFYAHRN